MHRKFSLKKFQVINVENETLKWSNSYLSNSKFFRNKENLVNLYLNLLSSWYLITVIWKAKVGSSR